MAELVVGAFLSATLQVAFERLASRDLIDYFRGRKLRDGLLKKLRITLISINQVLEDAEEMQYRNKNVKQWLDELKDAVFKAEDLLDEIATEASRQKLKAELHPTTSKVRNFLTTFANLFDQEIESRIQELLDHLDLLAEQKDKLGLKEGSSSDSEGGMGRKLSKRLPTTSLVEESKIYGRNDDKEEIIQILLSHDMSDNPVNVTSITGMGGVGKTALAQLVYNDKRVMDQFHIQAWVSISEEFDVVQLTKTILRAFHCSTKDSDDLNQYQLQLKDKLIGKKFFLVLDDVWNENRTSWDVFQSSLNYGAPGSKILATTRVKKVASVMHSTHIYPLKPLEDEYCSKLFARHAFNDQHIGIDPNLISIGDKIVKKCGGLPLAIKTLGSLLYTELSPQKWVKILESDIWNLSEDDSDIIPALRLSYHYLPSNLKHCFAYCSIFPKGYAIEKNVLISLWMAEGLLHSCQKDQSIENIGDEYFSDLESRSFFEPSGCYFIMHDLLNDLAKSVMGEFCSRLEGDMVQDIPIKTRYISFLDKYYRKHEIFEPIFKCNQLRSFISFDMNSFNYFLIFSLVNCDIKYDDVLSRLTCLKYMRVLSLKGFKNVKKLANICNLQHLRYLDLSHTQIEKLPDSICSMINLQTLKLKECKCLVKLPSNFQELINLRHLDLEGAGITKMPKNMGKLHHLQTLTQFVVRKDRGSDMMELGKLNQLKDSLVISKLENIIDPTNAREANMKNKKYLDKLEFAWGMIQDLEMSLGQERVLEALQPHSNLKKLEVRGYVGTRFPNWLDGPYLPNLLSLEMRSCTSCINLPPLGQLPFLENLHISEFDGIKVIGHEFYGSGSSSAPFQSLSSLNLASMKEWEDWNICYDGESFPRLQKLSIWNCPKLTKSLPQHLPSLKELCIHGCENLQTSLPKVSAMEELFLMGCKSISLKDMPTCSLTDVGNSRSSVAESSLLPPLRSLTLIDCPEMESLPQRGLLSSLRRLSIHDCPKVIASRKDWDLHELHCLKVVVVGDDFENVESFPEEGLLPANVQSLGFEDCLNLKTINYRGLLHLQSLYSLYICDCPTLSFEGLPEEGLPKSLFSLEICGHCPLLKQRCQRDKGEDWPKISHIPHVRFRLFLMIGLYCKKHISRRARFNAHKISTIFLAKDSSYRMEAILLKSKRCTLHQEFSISSSSPKAFCLPKQETAH